MGSIGFFTAPQGESPNLHNLHIVGYGDDFIEALNTSDDSGKYMLYQCVLLDGSPMNIMPMCRTSTPIKTKPLIYLDTSAISHLAQEDAPDKLQATQAFWKAAKAGKFRLTLSDATLSELYRCPSDRRRYLFDQLGNVVYTIILTAGVTEIQQLAYQLRKLHALPMSSVMDSVHLAAAICLECDVVASWNFKHMTRAVTIQRARPLTRRPLTILSPAQIMEVYG